MPFNVTTADNALLQKASLQIYPTPAPVDDFLPGVGNTIPFQFPPRIIADGKTAKWSEIPSWSYEPVVYWETSDARKIQIEAHYVVTTRSGVWTAKHISDIMKTYRAYFYRTRGDQKPTNMPLFTIRMYENIPEQTKWRSQGVSIHSDGALINDGGVVFNLHTKVILEAQLVTQIKGRRKDSLEKVQGLASKPKKEWY